MLGEADPALCTVCAVGAVGERSDGVPGRDCKPGDWEEVVLSRLR